MAFYAVSVCFSLSLFLFFYFPYANAVSFLVGLTIAAELLGTARFGLVSCLSLSVLVLHYFFYVRMRFTSTYTRFLVSLAIMICAYCILLFPFAGMGSRILHGMGLLIPLGITAYLLAQKEERQAYELL
jgi:hypothetical protein